MLLLDNETHSYLNLFIDKYLILFIAKMDYISTKKGLSMHMYGIGRCVSFSLLYNSFPATTY